MRRRSLETLALALGLCLAAVLVGAGGLAAVTAFYLWLAELLNPAAALALVGLFAITVGGLTAWTILSRVRTRP